MSQLHRVTASFGAENANRPVVVRDYFMDTPLRIYHAGGALMDELGRTVTDSSGNVEVWLPLTSTMPEIQLVAGSGALADATPSSPVTAAPSAGPSASYRVGQIQYFSEPPGAGWLPCDGSAVLRTAHPEYAAMRPDPALAVELVDPATLPEHQRDLFSVMYLRDGSIQYSTFTSTPGRPD